MEDENEREAFQTYLETTIVDLWYAFVREFEDGVGRRR